VAAQTILANDPLLQQEENRMILHQIESTKKSAVNWSKVS
jgi:hypothetical protein